MEIWKGLRMNLLREIEKRGQGGFVTCKKLLQGAIEGFVLCKTEKG